MAFAHPHCSRTHVFCNACTFVAVMRGSRPGQHVFSLLFVSCHHSLRLPLLLNRAIRCACCDALFSLLQRHLALWLPPFFCSALAGGKRLSCVARVSAHTHTHQYAICALLFLVARSAARGSCLLRCLLVALQERLALPQLLHMCSMSFLLFFHFAFLVPCVSFVA